MSSSSSSSRLMVLLLTSCQPGDDETTENDDNDDYDWQGREIDCTLWSVPSSGTAAQVHVLNITFSQCGHEIWYVMHTTEEEEDDDATAATTSSYSLGLSECSISIDGQRRYELDPQPPTFQLDAKLAVAEIETTFDVWQVVDDDDDDEVTTTVETSSSSLAVVEEDTPPAVTRTSTSSTTSVMLDDETEENPPEIPLSMEDFEIKEEEVSVCIDEQQFPFWGLSTTKQQRGSEPTLSLTPTADTLSHHTSFQFSNYQSSHLQYSHHDNKEALFHLQSLVQQERESLDSILSTMAVAGAILLFMLVLSVLDLYRSRRKASRNRNHYRHYQDFATPAVHHPANHQQQHRRRNDDATTAADTPALVHTDVSSSSHSIAQSPSPPTVLFQSPPYSPPSELAHPIDEEQPLSTTVTRDNKSHTNDTTPAAATSNKILQSSPQLDTIQAETQRVQQRLMALRTSSPSPRTAAMPGDYPLVSVEDEEENEEEILAPRVLDSVFSRHITSSITGSSDPNIGKIMSLPKEHHHSVDTKKIGLMDDTIHCVMSTQSDKAMYYSQSQPDPDFLLSLEKMLQRKVHPALFPTTAPSSSSVGQQDNDASWRRGTKFSGPPHEDGHQPAHHRLDTDGVTSEENMLESQLVRDSSTATRTTPPRDMVVKKKVLKEAFPKYDAKNRKNPNKTSFGSVLEDSSKPSEKVTQTANDSTSQDPTLKPRSKLNPAFMQSMEKIFCGKGHGASPLQRKAPKKSTNALRNGSSKLKSSNIISSSETTPSPKSNSKKVSPKALRPDPKFVENLERILKGNAQSSAPPPPQQTNSVSRPQNKTAQSTKSNPLKLDPVFVNNLENMFGGKVRPAPPHRSESFDTNARKGAAIAPPSPVRSDVLNVDTDSSIAPHSTKPDTEFLQSLESLFAGRIQPASPHRSKSLDTLATKKTIGSVPPAMSRNHEPIKRSSTVIESESIKPGQDFLKTLESMFAGRAPPPSPHRSTSLDTAVRVLKKAPTFPSPTQNYGSVEQTNNISIESGSIKPDSTFFQSLENIFSSRQPHVEKPEHAKSKTSSRKAATTNSSDPAANKVVTKKVSSMRSKSLNSDPNFIESLEKIFSGREPTKATTKPTTEGKAEPPTEKNIRNNSSSKKNPPLNVDPRFIESLEKMFGGRDLSSRPEYSNT